MGDRISLGILDGYAVRWSRETVVRDVVQNFFDEARDFNEVVIDVDDARERVHVEGPSKVALDYLRYLGATTKSEPERRSAGGFGEGFKVCALVLTRDYGAEVTAGSGTYLLRAELSPMKLGKELCYDVAQVEAHPGSFVTIERADAKLRDAFRKARELFRWPGNPRLAKPIFVDDASGVGVYEALDPHRGEIFYRRQLRGRARFAKGGALALCHDARLPALDKDRDRRDLRGLKPLLVAVAAALSDDALSDLLARLRRYWQSGHPFLAAVLREAARRGLSIRAPSTWLAKTKDSPRELALLAERRGYRIACIGLGDVGVPTLVGALGPATAPREPTALEHARVELARALYRELTGKPAPGSRRLAVLESGDSSRLSDDKRVVVLARHLGGSFEAGIAPLLAALARAGYRHKSTDGDRLTAILEGVLRRPLALAGWARSWDALEADTLAPPPPPEEEALEGNAFDPAHITWSVLAPPGLPPAEALEARVRALARQRRVKLGYLRESVCGPNDAAFSVAYGVPTLVIGSVVVGKPPRARVGCYANFMTPDDAQIVAALEAMQPKTGRRRRDNPYVSRLQRGHLRADARRRARDPAYARRRAREEALGELAYDGDFSVERQLLASLAQEWLASAPDALSPVQAAQWALAEGRSQAAALEAWRVEEQLGAHGASAARARYLPALREGGGLEVLSRWAAAWRALEERLDAAAIDEHCAKAAFAHALCALKAPEEPEAALEALDEAVALARARHEERDEWGAAPSCYSLSTELAKRRGDTPSATAARTAAAVEAVEAAWRRVIDAGGDERAALEAALEAALPFDRAPKP